MSVNIIDNKVEHMDCSDNDLNHLVPDVMDAEDELLSGEQHFVFEFPEIKRLASPPYDNQYSETRMLRGLPWRVLLTNRVYNSQRQLGCFLQCNAESEANAAFLGWSCTAHAEIRMKCFLTGGQDFVKPINHTFYAKENDWGFAHFMIMSEVLDPAKGYLKNDTTLVIYAHVNAEPPQGAGWDSRKVTGYIGLRNQGATCYMNSLLQTLFFTNKLRQAVYQMPTDNDDIQKSVPLALQKVFYELQFSDTAVGTKKLTRSFGWESYDSFMQHDVQELSRVLIENMENKMKGTDVEGTIPKLLEGKFVSLVICTNVEYKSRREEAFYDLQLPVKDCRTILDSFDKYTEANELDGDNKYDAGSYGLQPANKLVKFVKFPAVLHFQLLRFTYDPEADAFVKINDRYEFPEELQLHKYLENPAEVNPAETEYVLQSVLVHSGDNSGGHYVVYICPKADGKWYKFDDEIVSTCSRREATVYNYGGFTDSITTRHNTSAYMLVYIRKMDIPNVLDKSREPEVPASLRERLDHDTQLEEQRRKEKEEAHLFLNILICTEDDIRNSVCEGDLYNFERPPSISMRVLKTLLMRDFVKQVGEEQNLKNDTFRLWLMMERPNGTTRPSIIESEYADKPISDIQKHVNSVNFFMETIDPMAPSHALPNHRNKTDTLLFFKYYNPDTEMLQYVCNLILEKTTTLRSLYRTLISRVTNDPKLATDSRLLFFEEIKPTQQLSVEQEKHLDVAIQELTDGDIIIFQRQSTTQPVNDVQTFFRDVCNRVTVTFLDRTRPDDVGIEVTLSGRANYQEVAARLSRHINCNPDMIQFFQPTPHDSSAMQPIRPTPHFTLKEYLPRARNKKLHYQLLTIPVQDLESKYHIRATWLTEDLKEEDQISVYPMKTSNVEALLADAAKVKGCTLEKRLRLTEVMSCKITRRYPDNHPLDTLSSSSAAATFRIEEISAEFEGLRPGSKEALVPVAHYHKDAWSTFGTPFFMRLTSGETWASVRERLRTRLEVPDKEFEKYKLAHVNVMVATPLADDDTVNLSLFLNNTTQSGGFKYDDCAFLGLEHQNKNLKRSKQFGQPEKAIKIHN